MSYIDPDVFGPPSLEQQFAALGCALDCAIDSDQWGEAVKLNAQIRDRMGRAWRVMGPLDPAGLAPNGAIGFASGKETSPPGPATPGGLKCEPPETSERGSTRG